MSGIKLKLAAMTALLPAMLLASEAHAVNATGAAIEGAIAGAAIGAAVSSAVKHPQPIYVRPLPPPPPAWNQVISPRPGVLCYPAQQLCYTRSGAYAPAWTYQVFGR